MRKTGNDLWFYSEARDAFLEASADVNAKIFSYRHDLKGPQGEGLFTDVAIVGDPRAKSYVVVMSGTHGVEGCYGSKSQVAWMREMEGRKPPEGVAIVFIHLINPWGAAWVRRTNENNVDLNRNFVDFYSGVGGFDAEKHDHIYRAYSCSKNIGDDGECLVDLKVSNCVREAGWGKHINIVEAGQYKFSDGLFFGGNSAEWSNLTLRKIVNDHLLGAESLVFFDLHTGAGDYGHPMLMSITEAGNENIEYARKVYGPWLYEIITSPGEVSDTGVSASARGYTSQAIIEMLPGKKCIPLVIECGTYDSKFVHSALKDDNCLHNHGSPLSEKGYEVKKVVMEAFNPSDKDWEELVVFRTLQILRRARFVVSDN